MYNLSSFVGICIGNRSVVCLIRGKQYFEGSTLISFHCAWVDVHLSGRFVEGRGRGSHTSVCGRMWVWSGRARDHYASEISNRKHTRTPTAHRCQGTPTSLIRPNQLLFFLKTNHSKSRKKSYRTVACGIAIWSQSILQVTQNILIFIVLELRCTM